MSFLLTVTWFHLYAVVSAKYCDPPLNTAYASLRFCQSGTVSSSNVYVNGSSILTKEPLIGKECVCHVVWSGNSSSLLVYGLNSCVNCGLDVKIKDFLFTSGNSSSGYGIVELIDKEFQISMKISSSPSLENISPDICFLLRGNGGIDINLTLTCEDINMPSVVSTMKSFGNGTSTNTPTTATAKLPISLKKDPQGTEIFSTSPQDSIHYNSNGTVMTDFQGFSTARSASNINEAMLVAAAAGGFGVGVVVVIGVVIIIVCYRRQKRNNDMQRSSSVPPREYTELEFNSRDGQNNSHVYNSIDRQNTYVNDVK